MNINVSGALRAWGAAAVGAGAQAAPLVGQENEGSGAASNTPPSSVTLSAEARVLARFAERGLAVSVHALNAPRELSETFVPIPRDELEALFTRMGARPEEVEELIQGFDVDGQQGLSQDELLSGLARTMKDGNSSFAQTLMRVMDRLDQADGSVSQREFVSLETRLLAAGGR